VTDRCRQAIERTDRVCVDDASTGVTLVSIIFRLDDDQQ
jgi:hypothetical protein